LDHIYTSLPISPVLGFRGKSAVRLILHSTSLVASTQFKRHRENLDDIFKNDPGQRPMRILIIKNFSIKGMKLRTALISVALFTF
jgi:hypothetical protein